MCMHVFTYVGMVKVWMACCMQIAINEYVCMYAYRQDFFTWHQYMCSLTHILSVLLSFQFFEVKLEKWRNPCEAIFTYFIN